MAYKPGVNYVGFVDVLVIIVVLDQCQRIWEGGVRNEGRRDPVVDQTIRHFDGPSTRPELRHDLSCLDLLSSLWVAVRPEEWAAAMERFLHYRLSVASVCIERLYGLR